VSAQPTTSSSDIAVVGMACRFPGAPNVERFWENLEAGRESITFFSNDELLAAGVAPEVVDDPFYVKAGPILPDVESFDADFFRITGDEAEILDPQQRIFLECAVEAFENAGYDPERFRGAVGVYAGVGLNTYLLRNLGERYRAGSPVERYRLMLAGDKDYLTTRLSYKLNLRGPSVSVNTACSTSLVAVNMACLALQSGECDMAIAGAAHVKVPQAEGYLFQPGLIFSPDGHCRAFDANAAGTVLGNGAGVVVLKRLDDALADGDWIQAVIRGSAINNDGARKASFTAPSVEGQAAAIREAIAMSGCDPATISYVEAHGTGTPLGDPIEFEALTRAFDGVEGRTRCAIGSVKTNIGHLDVAAGMAGLIKTILMLQHKRLVPSLHYERPNPAIAVEESPFYVATESQEWISDGSPRRAGVSSFGIGGTNAHLVLEEPPARVPTFSAREEHLLLLSARSAPALEKTAQELARRLRYDSSLDVADVAYTLAVGRRHDPYRLALICRDSRDAALTLALADRRRIITGRAEETPHDASPVPAELATAALLWAGGAEFDWDAFHGSERRQRVPLPARPFERKRYWIDPPDRQAIAIRAARPKLREQVDRAGDPQRTQLLISFIQQEIARILGSDDAIPQATANLFELGIDSLILIEVAATLSAELDYAVLPAAFIDHFTIRTFAEYLLQTMGMERGTRSADVTVVR